MTPTAQATKVTLIELKSHQNLKTFLSKDSTDKLKDNPQGGKIYYQNIYLIRM